MSMVGRATLAVILLASCSKEYGVSAIAGSEPAVNPEDFMPCGFSETAVPGMRMYDCNPVFEATEEMWFSDTGVGDDEDGLGGVLYRPRRRLPHLPNLVRGPTRRER